MAAVINTPESRAQHYRDITNFYTGQGFKAINRHWVYQAQLGPDIQKVVLTSISAGAAAGALAGKSAGETLIETYFPDEDLKSNSLKMRAGRWIGIFLGAATGAVVTTYLYITIVENTDKFKAWREMKISQALKEFITLNYSDDVILEEHCCPISLVPMTIPARTPSGVYYDLEYILNCPREVQNDNVIRDPMRNPSFREDAIVIDYERGILINKRIRHLLQSDMARLGEDSPLRDTLGEQITAIERIIRNHYDSAKEVIEEKRRANQLSAEEYLAELARFFASCGESVEQNLVWAR